MIARGDKVFRHILVAIGLTSRYGLRHQPSFRTASRAACACSSDLIPEIMAAILPSAPITKVVRSMPMYFLPYMLFSLSTPNCLAADLSSSDRSAHWNLNFSLNFFSAEGLSGEMPRTTAPAFWNFEYASRNPDASAVQPEVLALG